MQRISARNFRSRAVLAPALAAALLSSVAADAGTRVATPEDGRQCRLGAEMHRWGPGDGPPARFVAERFAGGAADAWIGLGYTAEGFWSAESGAASDACDKCETLDLVLTRFDGTRRSFPVITLVDVRRLDGSPPEATRDLALQRLWHLAATDWPAAQMRQNYTFRLPPTLKPDGTADPFPGWMVEVSQPGGWLLRFAQHATQSMCWCMYEWRGWKPAAPRGK